MGAGGTAGARAWRLGGGMAVRGSRGYTDTHTRPEEAPPRQVALGTGVGGGEPPRVPCLSPRERTDRKVLDSPTTDGVFVLVPNQRLMILAKSCSSEPKGFTSEQQECHYLSLL